MEQSSAEAKFKAKFISPCSWEPLIQVKCSPEVPPENSQRAVWGGQDHLSLNIPVVLQVSYGWTTLHVFRWT